jgi:threo-3-hydroxy-L-aspartate ammonia-lyase
MVTYKDVLAASERMAGVAHRTPVLTSTTANEMAGAQLFFKAENFQRMGAFKFRGAYNAISKLTPEGKAGGVIAYSSGNHAQAIALAAKLLDTSSVIVMPEDAPAVKIEATKGYGAEVVLYDRYNESREEIGQRLAQERGMTLIPPFDHPDVIAGQGTATKELFEDAGPMDVLITPLGGGGLLAGSALAAKALNPDCVVYGVEPEAGNDGQQSFRSGELVTIPAPRTIADGAQTLRLGDITFPVIREHVTDIVTATDDELVDAMRFFAGRMKIVVEPTGCLAAAAVFAKRVDIVGKRVGILLSGGNIDLARYADLLKGGIS